MPYIRVGFVVAGAQKAGTTALDAYLRSHPDISMASQKEVHFFDNDDAFSAGQPLFDDYHKFFNAEDYRAGKLLGEATPSYIFLHRVAARIWQYNRNMKFIVILRNPIERAFSHWNMEHSRGAESLSFFDAMTHESMRGGSALENQHLVYSYVARGFYSSQLQRLWNVFPKQQVLALKYDDLCNQPVQFLNRICEFLNVSPLTSVPDVRANVIAYDSEMSEQEWCYLQHLFQPETRRLERMLGWDCRDWLARPTGRRYVVRACCKGE